MIRFTSTEVTAIANGLNRFEGWVVNALRGRLDKTLAVATDFTDFLIYLKADEQLMGDAKGFLKNLEECKNIINNPLSTGNFNESEINLVGNYINNFIEWLFSQRLFLRLGLISSEYDSGDWEVPAIFNVFFLRPGANKQITIQPDADLLEERLNVISQLERALEIINNPTLPKEVDFSASSNITNFDVGEFFKRLDDIYTKVNNDNYITITRAYEIKGYCLQTLLGIHNTRIELKEARQDIKFLGRPIPDDEFTDEAGTIFEFLIRLRDTTLKGVINGNLLQFEANAIARHQTVNDTLYEIRVLVQDIESFVEAIRGDTNVDLPSQVNTLQASVNAAHVKLDEILNRLGS